MQRITTDEIAQAISILQHHHVGEMDDARAAIANAWGRAIGVDTVKNALADRGLPSPQSYMLPRRTAAERFASLPRSGRVGTEPVGHAPSAGVRDCGKQEVDAGRVDVNRGITSSFEPLLRATRKPITFAKLCDTLDLSPLKVRRLVNDAQAAGYSVQVAGDAIGWQEPEPVQKEREVLPTTGKRTIVGIMSDTHFGSKYCLRKQIRDFIQLAYDAGVRIILHSGDMLDGIYDHGRWELSHHGLEEQIQDCLDTLPQLEGLRYLFITGNHDSTFWKQTGYPTGLAIQNAAERAGRTDLEYVGACGAMLKVCGAKVELWHPKKSGAYSLSYHLQNKIRDTALGHKPDILLAGHWHTSVYLEQRGIHALACGTFQGGGSEFGKSLGGAPSIGGTLLSWETTEHGTLRRVSVERVAYYEQEQPREVA